MSDDPNWSLQELREVIPLQQELLRFVLYVLSEGPAEFLGQRFASTMEWDKARAVAAVSMGAGQSMNTVLKLSHEEGIGRAGPTRLNTESSLISGTLRM